MSLTTYDIDREIYRDQVEAYRSYSSEYRRLHRHGQPKPRHVLDGYLRYQKALRELRRYSQVPS